MGIQATPQELLRSFNDGKPVSDTALRSFVKNFDAFSALRRANFYTQLVAAWSHIPGATRAFPRLVEKFANISLGDGKQIYMLTGVNPTPGEKYDPEFNSVKAADFLLGAHKPDLRTSAIAALREWTKPLTVQGAELQAAGFDETMSLASQIIDSLENSDRINEYEVILDMFFDAVRRDIGFRNPVPPPLDADSARNYSAAVGAVAEFTANPSDRYNPERMRKVFDKADLLFITRVTTWQKIAKEQYSNTFQTQYMRGIPDDQVVAIADEFWPGDLANVSGVLISRSSNPNDSTIIIKDNSISHAAIVNEAQERVNHSILHRSVYGLNPFGVMVVFENGTEVLPETSNPVPVEVDFEILLNGAPVTELLRGYSYKVVAAAKQENGYTAGGADVTLTGESSPTRNTFLDATELNLYIGLDEPATSLTLTAAASLDDSVTAVKVLNVNGTRMQVIPPFDVELTLTGTSLASVSGNTATPPSETVGYDLTYSGTVAGAPVAETAFTTPVTLTTAGDTITLKAKAQDGYKLNGTKTRTVNYS